MKSSSNRGCLDAYVDGIVDVSYINKNGENVLFFCRSHDRQKYIDMGADVNLRNIKGKTLIHYSTTLNEIKEAFENGFIIESTDDYSDLDYEQAKKLVHYLPLEKLKEMKINAKLCKPGVEHTLIFELNDIDKIKYLVEMGLDINHKDNTGSIYFANTDKIDLENKRKIKHFLLESGLDINNINSAGRTLLHYEKEMEFLKILVERSTVLNQTCETHGRTCLFKATPERMKLLIDSGVDINIKGKNGRLAFHEASEESQLYMIDKGLDLNYEDKKGRGLLFHSFISEKVLKRLIEKGIDINKQDTNGMNALFYQNEDKAKILVEYGIDFNVAMLKSMPEELKSKMKPEKIAFLEGLVIKRETSHSGTSEYTPVKRL